jgi:hypothetical protein
VTDLNGNYETSELSVGVLDMTAPFVMTQPVELFLNLSGSVSISASSVDNGTSDACGVASIYLNQSTFGCVDVGDLFILFSGVDVHGNIASVDEQIKVIDAVVPSVVAMEYVSIDLNSTGIGSLTPADVDISSWDACGIDRMELSQSSFACGDVGNVSILFSVTDVFSNIANNELFRCVWC